MSDASQSSGTERFETYVQEYEKISLSLSQKIKSQIPNYSGEQKRTCIESAVRDVDNAEGILARMNIELRSLSPTLRSKLEPRFREYQAHLKSHERELNRLRTRMETRLSEDDLEEAIPSSDHRERLLDSTARLERTSEGLDRIITVSTETEQIGAGILRDLQLQREQIERTRNQVSDADQHVSRADQILNAMARRIKTNKAIVWFIIALMVFIICGIIYLKVR